MACHAIPRFQSMGGTPTANNTDQLQVLGNCGATIPHQGILAERKFDPFFMAYVTMKLYLQK